MTLTRATTGGPPEPIPEAALVSVVITSYNYGRFLDGAIESVLAQTYAPIEVVVVDDGSTDETADVAHRYAARGVRYVRTENSGAAKARNTGLAATEGPIVAFLDADDVFLPDKLDRQIAHMRAHPEVALVASHAYACDERMERESVVHAAEYPSRWMLERLLIHNVVLNPTCVLVRRPALEAVGGFSEIPKWEDWDTWLRISKLYPLGFLPEVLANVRRHHRGLSPQDGYEHLVLDRAILDRHIGDVEPGWKRRLLCRRARSVSYFHFARLMVDIDRDAARTYSVRALLLDPTVLTRRKVASVVRTRRRPRHAKPVGDQARP
jgi:glycosyltransferase involved in cell wall biosynthesis